MDDVRSGIFLLDVLQFHQQNAICPQFRVVLVDVFQEWLMSCEPDLHKPLQSLLMSGWWFPGPAIIDCARAKSHQLCPTLCDPMGCSPPGSSIHWILQARILEWVAMPSSKGSPPLAGGFFTASSTWGPPVLQRGIINLIEGFPGGSDAKESACNVGDLGSVPGLGRAPGEGNGNPLQYSCLETSMDRGIWEATVHGVAKSWT